jgi:phytoene synthase
MSNQSQVMRTHGKTFFWASWFLEREVSNRLYAIYAFCRRIDDLVDESNDEVELSKNFYDVINAWENNEYHHAFEEFKGIPRNYLPREEIIKEFLKGQASDLNHHQPKNIKELLIYCYRVAGVVGLMVCDSMEIKDKKLKYFAIDLGIAMQLTNICRDIKEDAERGRIYLPINIIKGLSTENILSPTKQQLIDINQARDHLLNRADLYYESGYQGIEHLPKKTARSLKIAAQLYQGIGKKMLKSKKTYLDGRIYLNKLEKSLISMQIVLRRNNINATKIHNHLLHDSIRKLPDSHNK